MVNQTNIFNSTGENMYLRDPEQTKKVDVPAGTNTSMQVLISADEAPNFAMRKFTINPGGSMPNHTNSVEHEQYVLNGKAKVTIGDDVVEASKDNVLYIPAGIPHSYTVIGDEPYEFLCLIPNKEDLIELK